MLVYKATILQVRIQKQLNRVLQQSKIENKVINKIQTKGINQEEKVTKTNRFITLKITKKKI